MFIARDSDGSTGSARRRRERRMRSWWRLQQPSIRMVLATVLHHSVGKVDTAHDFSTEPDDSHQDRGSRYAVLLLGRRGATCRMGAASCVG